MTNLAAMAITSAEARQQILDDLGDAIDRIGLAASRLGDTYEVLTTAPADRMEAELYMPVQKAFGRAKRTYTGYAERSRLEARSFPPPQQGAPSAGARGWIEQAVEAVAEADYILGDLQDSEIFIEFGDPELRAGLSESRSLLAQLPGAATAFLRTLGR
jgi:hypothetical protein